LPWSAPFPDAIPTADKPLVTLSDAAEYLMALPSSERHSHEWLAAVEAILRAAEGLGPMTDAQIGMLRLLAANKGLQKPSSPLR
jgi:hypothetical protein